MPRNARLQRTVLALWGTVSAFGAGAVAEKQLTIEISDYFTMPMTGSVDGKGQNAGNLARINFLREEPGGARNRFFVNDQNGPLYILDKRSKQLITYLDFNGRNGKKGIFHRFTYDVGFAAGLICFQFDPDYERNGRFYTIHMEDPAVKAAAEPDNSSAPGLSTTGYKTTEPVKTPGRTLRETVLLEWTDTDTANATFEGSVRELLRIPFTTQIHPLGDMIFNPTARRGDADWRVMYLGCGDGGAGESSNLNIRHNPQRLDSLTGKILRILPDLEERKESGKVSENGRYRIPGDNPFVGRAGARPEVWAYGLRNPHRLVWENNYLLANVVGLSSWETVVFVHKGGNYGYSEREGNQQLVAPQNKLGPIPHDDRIPVRIGEEPSGEMVKPLYPVVEYDHSASGGDGIAGGLVYQGKIKALRGKFVLADITTGRIWWSDFQEMVAADGGNPAKMAAIHEVSVLVEGADGKKELYRSFAPVASAAYHNRGGTIDPLPGYAKVGKGRVDLRLALDAGGELYFLSKSDGMIRKVVGARER